MEGNILENKLKNFILNNKIKIKLKKLNINFDFKHLKEKFRRDIEPIFKTKYPAEFIEELLGVPSTV